MIITPAIVLKRPGIVIPVFFLCLFQATGTCQVHCPETASAALGNCILTVQGFSCASQNPAGLGYIEQSTLSIQHSRPFLLKELGCSAISAQFTTGSGGIGLALASQALTGFRQSSLWLSYGMKLHPQISAGVGIHFWNSTIEEQFFYAPGISFALGLQIRINERWNIGGRLFHPAGWSAFRELSLQEEMSVAAGCSYSFLNTGTFFSEVHIKADQGLVLCNGLEWILNQKSRLRTGISTRPFSFSSGVQFKFTRWIMEFSFLYRPDSGMTPFTSLSHAW